MARVDEAKRRAAPGGRRLAVGLAVLAVLVAATLAVWFFALEGEMPLPGFDLDAEGVEELIRSWGVWGMLGTVLLMVLHSFVPFPAEFVAMANGMLYGPVLGTALTWTGAMLGAWLAFGLARLFGRPFVRSMLAARHHRAVDDWAERQGTGALIFSRLIPVISFNLINYAAGLTAISWWTFTWATGLGILPLTTLMVMMGDGLWQGESGLWIWLVGAAVVGWCVWWAVRRRLASGNAEAGGR